MNRSVIFSVLIFSIVLSASEDKINTMLSGHSTKIGAVMNTPDVITQSKIQLEQIEPQEIIDETYLQANNTK